MTQWFSWKLANFKTLLDEVSVISRIMKVEVGVISRSQRLRLIALITLTESEIVEKLNVFERASLGYPL